MNKLNKNKKQRFLTLGAPSSLDVRVRNMTQCGVSVREGGVSRARSPLTSRTKASLTTGDFRTMTGRGELTGWTASFCKVSLTW